VDVAAADLPVYHGPFGKKEAERLLWRAGFGPKPGEAKNVARKGLKQAVDDLLHPPRARLIGPAPTAGGGERSHRRTFGAQSSLVARPHWHEERAFEAERDWSAGRDVFRDRLDEVDDLGTAAVRLDTGLARVGPRPAEAPLGASATGSALSCSFVLIGFTWARTLPSVRSSRCRPAAGPLIGGCVRPACLGWRNRA
jgi:hypothetical protein